MVVITTSWVLTTNGCPWICLRGVWRALWRSRQPRRPAERFSLLLLWPSSCHISGRRRREECVSVCEKKNARFKRQRFLGGAFYEFFFFCSLSHRKTSHPAIGGTRTDCSSTVRRRRRYVYTRYSYEIKKKTGERIRRQRHTSAVRRSRTTDGEWMNVSSRDAARKPCGPEKKIIDDDDDRRGMWADRPRTSRNRRARRPSASQRRPPLSPPPPR